MNIFEAIIYGIVQGLTEFIPVSSSGHLVLAHSWLGGDDSLLFDVALHAGTLLALLIYFNKDILVLTKAFFVQSSQTKLARLLGLATIPAVISGVLLESYAESIFRSPKLVATNLIVVALIMLAVERYYEKQKTHTKIESISTKQAVVAGLAQALAIVPGVSRSGSTITAGMMAGLDRVAAARFSFLLGVPIIFGALLKTLLSDNGLTEFSSQTGLFVVGIVTSFVFGLLAIKFLLGFLSNHGLAFFAYYRITLGIFVLALAYL